MASRGLRTWLPWLLCALSLGMFFLSGWLRWLSGDQLAADEDGWLRVTISSLGFAGIPIVGALMASRLPGNPYGWVWCAAGLAYAVSDVVQPLVEVVGGPLWVVWVLESWGFVSLIGLLVFVFLLFPTGRLPTYRWRWIARAAVTGSLLLVAATPFLSDPDDPEAGPWAMQGDAGRYLWLASQLGVSVMFTLVLAAMVSLGWRFRRAGPVERRQLTWFLYATVLNGVLLVVDSVGPVPPSLLQTVVVAVGFALLPVAVGVAVLRYRLYEIDRIVSRTVTYGLLTAAVFAVYLLVVGVLSQLGLPEGSSDVVVAAVTLAVAAVVGRVRRRLQVVVDRRFDRARYDADRAVAAFAARLRDQVDLDEVTAGLRDTVTATVAPARMAIWLRPADRG